MKILRRALDGFYRLSGALAAGFVVLIFASVIAQVGLNIADAAIAAIFGAPIGLLLPSYADFAGFFLAAATFLALAHTFHEHGHIRVTLVISRLSPGHRQPLEVIVLAVAAALSGFMTWRAALLAHDSWTFGDASYGLVSIPIWAPQLAFVFGALTLTVAIMDRLFAAILGYAARSTRSQAGAEG